MVAVYYYFSPSSSGVVEPTPTSYLESPVVLEEAPTLSAYPGVAAEPTDLPLLDSPENLIGLIAGHRGYDSGTVCEDGLTEVQITSELAEKVSALLLKEGIVAETLNEFDPRLDGYQAMALVALHIDSCDYINDLASGYKISASDSVNSGVLSTCVQEAYGKATGLRYHPNSITPEMAGYHAFTDIDSETPGIIIEVGFLNLDRQILTERLDIVARGIFDGIMCYVDT